MTSAVAPADDIHWASRFVNPGDSGGGGGGGYARLLDEGSTPGFSLGSSPARKETLANKRDARRLRRAREEAFEKTFAILPLDGGTLPDLVEVCMDLTFYQHKDLVSQARSLVITPLVA